MQGTLVRSLPVTGGLAQWDLRGEGGTRVSGGMYLARFRSAAGRWKVWERPRSSRSRSEDNSVVSAAQGIST